MSDSNGLMMFGKLDQFLKEALKLPTAVFEGPSFGYTEHAVRTCFPQQVRTLTEPGAKEPLLTRSRVASRKQL
jgi:hypothetical protein